MKRLLFATSMLVLCGAAFAQNTYKTSPNGLLTTEGYRAAYMFGEWQAARLMFFDGEMRTSVMLMKEIALRHDYRPFYNGNSNSNNGQGRNWTKVTLAISTCDITKINQNFALNPTTTPSKVFDASVTFPSMSGFPSSKPAPWALRFPFSASWLNNGASDICLDFDFNGGTLANAKSWATNWYQTYYTDAFNGGDSSSGSYSVLGTGCTDSGFTAKGSGIVFTNVYSSRYTTNVSYQNMYKVSTRSRYTAKGKPVVHVVSLFGNKTGITFPGVSCEKVFIDMTKPLYIFAMIAGTDSRATTSLNFPLIPYQKSLENIPFFMQAAWDDSSTTALKFTYAEETLLPPMPGVYNRQMIYQNDTTSKGTASTGKVFDAATHNPIFRYAQ